MEFVALGTGVAATADDQTNQRQWGNRQQRAGFNGPQSIEAARYRSVHRRLALLTA